VNELVRKRWDTAYDWGMKDMYTAVNKTLEETNDLGIYTNTILQYILTQTERLWRCRLDATDSEQV
jgi:hypothetical protein